ncbi:MAG: heparinase II/III family protein [Kiritimatiellae bacterium]|nr:heparinase II/III family protein [Kiritimatiellia bacterium]
MRARQRLNGALMLGLVSVSVMSTAPVARAMAATRRSFAVEPGHPRIYFTARDLPGLRRRIQTTHAEQWRSMKGWAEAHMGSEPHENALQYHSVAHAFAYALSGEKRYADEAIPLAKRLAALEVTSGDLENARRCRALAYVYDWCHDRLSAEDKAALRKGMKALADWLIEKPIGEGWFKSLGNHFAQAVTSFGTMGLAIHGDDPDAMKYVRAAVSAIEDEILPTLRYFSGPGDGMWHEGMEYTRHELIPVFEFLEVCRGALRENLFAPRFEQFVYGTLYGTYPDNTMLRTGDNHFPGTGAWERKYMSLLASKYRHPHAQWYVNHMTKPIGGGEAWYDILWYDPAVPETPVDDLPPARLFEGLGLAVLRTGWYEPDATVVSFKCGRFFGHHGHYDANSFAIYRKGCLALDSGGYDSWGSRHWRNYYTRTVAHNTLTIFDPDEDRANNFNGDVNDGGQLVFLKRNGAWIFPKTLDQALEKPQFDTGDIVAWEQRPGYTRALGDATRAYSAHKLKQFTRELALLHPTIKTNPPAIVVFDRVEATRADYAKKWLLHTAEKPEQVGPGAWCATEGDGTLYVRMLEPCAARVILVGGPGREFEVDGKNYPLPEKDVANRQPNLPGAWRIEIEPPKPAERDLFLNVLMPVDKDQPSIPAVSRMETDNMLGGFIKGERGEPDTVVWFARDKAVLADDEPISYRIEQGGEVRHLINDLPANVEYEIRLNGKVMQTQRTRDTRTRTGVKKDLAPSCSLSFTTGAGGTIAIAPVGR